MVRGVRKGRDPELLLRFRGDRSCGSDEAPPAPGVFGRGYRGCWRWEIKGQVYKIQKICYTLIMQDSNFALKGADHGATLTHHVSRRILSRHFARKRTEGCFSEQGRPGTVSGLSGIGGYPVRGSYPCLLSDEQPLSPAFGDAGWQPGGDHAPHQRRLYDLFQHQEEEVRPPFPGKIQGAAGGSGCLPGATFPLHSSEPGQGGNRGTSGSIRLVKLSKLYRTGRVATLAEDVFHPQLLPDRCGKRREAVPGFCGRTARPGLRKPSEGCLWRLDSRESRIQGDDYGATSKYAAIGKRCPGSEPVGVKAVTRVDSERSDRSAGGPTESCTAGKSVPLSSVQR